MTGIFQRLFGKSALPEATIQPAQSQRFEIKEYGHSLVSIPALDFFGHHALSPNGQFRLIWSDRDPTGTIGGHRYEGHGTWALLADDKVVAKGRLERPQDGKVADDGTFILHDWLFGDRLIGHFIAYRADGHILLKKELSANLMINGLSNDGKFAICQTANAPGSPDSCRYILFDLGQAQEITRWEPEAGWADGFEFDALNRRVYLVQKGDERVGYNFDGTMVNREGWQQRRIAAGDLNVIRTVLESVSGDPDAELRRLIVAGLDHAAHSEDVRQQARALRFLGELHEQSGEVDEAIKAYDNALMLDPQVGVSRRVEKLRKASLPKQSKPSAKKLGRFEQQAQRLGIEHELALLEQGATKEWRLKPTDPWMSVEEAALEHYSAEGWTGAAAEGGLMLTLIKAASFAALQPRNANTFVEALYTQNVAFDEDSFNMDQLIETAVRATRMQIERNWEVIAATAGKTPAYYPRVCLNHVTGLHEALGSQRLGAIARLFAQAPYDLRAGWPDLTLWRDGEIRFVEVKAPGDSMHASQARLISTILVPLGFRVGIAEVRPI